jgi:hypothetical protein
MTSRATAGFLLNLTSRRPGRGFAMIDVTAGNSQTQRSTMNRCRSIKSTRSPGSSSTAVIAQRRIRNTYWMNAVVPSGTAINHSGEGRRRRHVL